MTKWYFITTVEKASGWQRWSVEADTLEEAKTKADECEYDSEEVEVTALGEPEREEDA